MSRAVYDAPSYFFSLGNRAIRVLGFSPSFSVSYARNASSIEYYRTQRLRFRFALARYF